MSKEKKVDDLLEPCDSTKSYELRAGKMLDLKSLESKLSSIGEIKASTPQVLLIKSGEGSISIYKSGKILIKDIKKEDGEKIAKKIMEMIK